MGQVTGRSGLYLIWKSLVEPGPDCSAFQKRLASPSIVLSLPALPLPVRAAHGCSSGCGLGCPHPNLAHGPLPCTTSPAASPPPPSAGQRAARRRSTARPTLCSYPTLPTKQRNHLGEHNAATLFSSLSGEPATPNALPKPRDSRTGNVVVWVSVADTVVGRGHRSPRGAVRGEARRLLRGTL